MIEPLTTNQYNELLKLYAALNLEFMAAETDDTKNVWGLRLTGFLYTVATLKGMDYCDPVKMADLAVAMRKEVLQWAVEGMIESISKEVVKDKEEQ